MNYFFNNPFKNRHNLDCIVSCFNEWRKGERERKTQLERDKDIERAVVVAQLVERSLPTPEVRGSNPVIGKTFISNI